MNALQLLLGAGILLVTTWSKFYPGDEVNFPVTEEIRWLESFSSDSGADTRQTSSFLGASYETGEKFSKSYLNLERGAMDHKMHIGSINEVRDKILDMKSDYMDKKSYFLDKDYPEFEPMTDMDDNSGVHYKDMHLKESCRYVNCKLPESKLGEQHCFTHPDCHHTHYQGCEYRTVEGGCNNPYVTMMGMAGTPYRRLLQADYGLFELPRKDRMGGDLPWAGTLAEKMTPLIPKHGLKITYFAAHFWKFIYRDLVNTPKSDAENCCQQPSFRHGVKNESEGECYPVYKHNFYSGVECKEFRRNLRHFGLNCKGEKSEHLDLSSMWLDLSNIYGSSEYTAMSMRDSKDRRLLKISKSSTGQVLPPTCKYEHDKKACFYSGDKRLDKDPVLALQHLLFIKEHNRIARELSKLNKYWDNEKVFQEARRINIAQYQRIVYTEFLTVLLGSKFAKASKLSTSMQGNIYEKNLDTRISTEFATAALRLYHLEQDKIPLVQDSGKSPSWLEIETYEKNPSILAKKNFVDEAIRGLLGCLSGNEVTNIKFDGVDGCHIQRGRDRGIPGYNRYRSLLLNAGVTDFNQLSVAGLTPLQVKLLRKMYKSVDDIDLWLGGVLEKPAQQSLVGPTFRHILAEQFQRLKNGDRFWFENEDAEFSMRQLEELKKVSTASLLCNNFELSEVQENVFLKSDLLNKLTSCSKVYKLNLAAFSDVNLKSSVLPDLQINQDRSLSHQASSLSMAEKPVWSYSGLTGPAFWSASYPDCGGNSQSPLNIHFKNLPKSYAPYLKLLNFDALNEAVLEKNDHNVDLKIIDKSGFRTPTVSGGYLPAGVTYKFGGLHFHWGSDSTIGSEHRLNGFEYSGEAHYVHYNSKYDSLAEAANQPDGLLVLGFFLQVSSHSSIGMKHIVKGLSKMNSFDQHKIGLISISNILGYSPNPKKYIFYKGSLTTPPCTENVAWHVFPQPISVTEEDLNVFRMLKSNDGKSFNDNNRPVQLVNGRKVMLDGLLVIQSEFESLDIDKSVEVGQWSYSGKTGPEYWSKIYPACGGSSQSPISIKLTKQKLSLSVQLYPYNYKTRLPAVLERSEHNIDFKFEDSESSPLLMGGYIPNHNKFQFAGLHFHWGTNSSVGSEHSLNNLFYPAEAHFVHFNKKYGSLAEAADKDDGLLVMAFFLEIADRSSPGLERIAIGMKTLAKKAEIVHIGHISIYDIIGSVPNLKQYIFYKGSLTTPPCTQNVLWHVFPIPIPVSQHHLNIFRQLRDSKGEYLSDNFRPVQPLNGRQVLWNGRPLIEDVHHKGHFIRHDQSLKPYWSYSGQSGPEYWSFFYPGCGGKSQSPIDIPMTGNSQRSGKPVKFMNYDKVYSAILQMEEHNFDLKLKGQGFMPYITGGYFKEEYVFTALQFHWGSKNSAGSEHSLKGLEFPGEAHFVHYKRKYGSMGEAMTKPDGLLIMAFFLKISPKSTYGIKKIALGLKTLPHTDRILIGEVSLGSIVGVSIDPSKYVYYKGSTTSPPCNENVLWHVFLEPIPVSQYDLSYFRMLSDGKGNMLSDNYRPVQPLNGRQVLVNGEPLIPVEVTTEIVSMYMEQPNKRLLIPQSQDEHSKPAWSYHGLTGPAFWYKSYPECGGKLQSPIDVITYTAVKKSSFPVYPVFYNKFYPAVLQMNDHNVDLKFKGSFKKPTISGGYIPLGERYEFAGLHFHWGSNNSIGSEHRLNGYEYPAEAHFVHFNTKYGDLQTAAGQPDGLLVLGFFLQVKPRSSVGIHKIANGLRGVKEEGQELLIGELSVDSVLGYQTLREFFFYQGSLTTPPCTQNVLWHVFPQPVPISPSDLAEFRKLKNDKGESFSDNNRPTQKLNRRKILKKRING